MHMWIFSPRIWEELQFEGSYAYANKIPKQQYLWTRRQSVVPNDAPRDFGPEVAFGRQILKCQTPLTLLSVVKAKVVLEALPGAKFQIPVARQGGREMSAPRPYVTEPFRPLS